MSNIALEFVNKYKTIWQERAERMGIAHPNLDDDDDGGAMEPFLVKYLLVTRDYRTSRPKAMKRTMFRADSRIGGETSR